MSGSVEIVGLDNVLSKMERHNFTKCKVLCKSDVKFDMEVSGEITKEDIMEEFKNEFEFIPSTNYKIFKLELSYKDKNNKNKIVSTDFCFYTNQSGVSHWDKKEEKVSGRSKDTDAMIFQNGVLQTQNQYLMEKIKELTEEDDDESIGRVSVGEKLADVLLPHAPQIIAGIMNMFAKNTPIAVAGVPSDINQLMNEMLAIEPEFPEHLSMLISLRKDKPAIYTMALNQLKNL